LTEKRTPWSNLVCLESLVQMKDDASNYFRVEVAQWNEKHSKTDFQGLMLRTVHACEYWLKLKEWEM